MLSVVFFITTIYAFVFPATSYLIVASSFSDKYLPNYWTLQVLQAEVMFFLSRHIYCTYHCTVSQTLALALMQECICQMLSGRRFRAWTVFSCRRSSAVIIDPLNILESYLGAGRPLRACFLLSISVVLLLCF